MSTFRPIISIMFPLATPLVALTATEPSNSPAPEAKTSPSPLIDRVRAATARFKDINAALHEGWVVATPCVSGPDTGMNLIGAPNRYGLPAFWEMHVWGKPSGKHVIAAGCRWSPMRRPTINYFQGLLQRRRLSATV